MSYLCISFAAVIAGIGYCELQRRSFWENVDAGCFHGCLIAFGILVAVVVLGFVICLHLNYWGHVALGFGSLWGTILFAHFLDRLGERWEQRKRKEKEDDSS